MEALLGRLTARELLLDPRVRLLGLIPLTCWIFHYIRYAFVLQEPANMLWMCHVTALLLAVGLLASWASVVRVAAIWAIVGLPMWIIEVAARGYTSRISVLSHILVPIIAGIALSQVKAGRWSVVAHAMALFLVVQQVCRSITVEAFNINMAHKPYDALASDLVPSYPAYWVLTTAMLTGIVALVALATRRFFPADVEFADVVGVPAVVVVKEAPAPAPVAPKPSEPGFNLAPKMSPSEYRAAVAAAKNMPLPQAPVPAQPERAAPRGRGGLVVERGRKEQVPDDLLPRGFTLLEMVIVVAILGVMAALAVPDLTPAIHTARMRGAADEVIIFLERARRSAQAEGRCFKITLPTPNRMVMERLRHANCFDPVGGAPAGPWDPVASVTLQPGFAFVLDTLPGSTLIFRPNGRLRGDGDLDVTDDGARIAITTPAIANKATLVFVTPAGRICAFLVGGVPAFTTPSQCGAPPAGSGPPPTPPESGYA